MQNLKVSLMQCNQVWEDKEANLKHFESLLEKVSNDVDLIIFPEMFHTGFSMNADQLAESMDGQGVSWLRANAAKKNAAIIATIIIKENDVFYNRLIFMEPSGNITFYNKQKLFAYSGEDKFYTPGNERVIASYKDWKILLLTCYDLRFPEIARNHVNNGVYDYDLLVYPANWPSSRSLHWKRLLPARAIENQAYVIGVNRIGAGKNGLPYSGDSAAFNPLGEQVNENADGEQIFTVSLSKTEMNKIREDLPFLKDR